MIGQELLEQELGRRLTDGLIKSFYIDRRIANLINNTFLSFDDSWLRIVCTDDQTTVYAEKKKVDELNLKSDNIEFRVQAINVFFPEFNRFLGKKLLGFKELVLKKDGVTSMGLKLSFESDLHFIVRNLDYPVDRNEFFFEAIDFDDLVEKIGDF